MLGTFLSIKVIGTILFVIREIFSLPLRIVSSVWNFHYFFHQMNICCWGLESFFAKVKELLLTFLKNRIALNILDNDLLVGYLLRRFCY